MITSNPTIDFTERDVFLYYLTGGAAVFGCVGDPEGVILANRRSLALSDDGNVYFKTTDNANTGWTPLGGGGSGTVTSVALSMPGIFSVAGSPITGAGTFTVTLASQLQNLFFASPNGSAGVPSFRAIAAADLSGVALASPPTGGIQFNNGSNGFLADPDFSWDTASGTLQIGLAAARAGKIDLRGAVSGSVRLTVDQPVASPVQYQFGNAVPATGDLWRAANVTGNNITLGFVAPGSLGFASVNPTSGVLPYNNAGVFADSPLFRVASDLIGFGGATTQPALFSTATGFYGSSGLFARSGSSSTGIYFGARLIVVANSVNPVSGDVIRLNGATSTNVFEILNTGEINWSSSGGATGSKDSGITRRQAGVLRITNGGSGAGILLAGTSTGIALGQIHSDSQAVGRSAFYGVMPASFTVPAIKCETSSIQSFALYATGKLQGGMNAPVSNQQWSAIGNAKSDVSTIGNVGTGEDNLLAFSIPANSLANTGDYAEFDAFGEFENNADNKTLKIIFGGTTIFNTGALAFGVGALANWRINAKIIRTAASGQKCIVTFWCNDATTSFLQTITTSGEDLTTNLTVQFTGEGTTTDDVTQLHLESKLCVAQTS